MLILKFHPRMNCLHVFFSFFHSGMKFHPCLSSLDEISSRQKRVNSKRHFTIDRDDFILGRVSSQDEVSRVNNLLELVYLINYIFSTQIILRKKYEFNIVNIDTTSANRFLSPLPQMLVITQPHVQS